MMDMVRDAFAVFEQRMQTEDKDGICYQRVSLDDVLPGEEQLRRIEAIADPYAMQPQSIMEEQESRRELYNGLQRLTDREQTYLLYRYGFTDGEEHPLIGTAIYFHLTKSRAKKTEEQAMDNLWLELRGGSIKGSEENSFYTLKNEIKMNENLFGSFREECTF